MTTRTFPFRPRFPHTASSLCVYAALTLTACGSDESPTETASVEIDPCAVVTAADVEQVLSVANSEADRPSEANNEYLATCRYVAPEGQGLKVITVMVTSPEYGRAGFETAKEQPFESEDVTGVGDDAFWMSDLNTLHVLGGDVHISISGDVDLEQAKAHDKLADLRRQLAGVLAASRQGSLLREGIHVVIAGEPNVGKSSLMNCLAGEELAIVTDIPGTTRDAIRQTINVRGVPLHMVDTAGLREPEDKVEKIGISRTWDEISKSNLVLWVSDATVPETRIADPVVAARLPKGVPQIVVINKVDLCGRNPARYAGNKTTEVALSAKTGAGIELLRDAILDAIGWGGSGEGLFMARERHLQALQTAQTHVDQASASIPQLELLAEELRLAQRALAGITGEFTADDLLGEIFSRFCIGK